MTKTHAELLPCPHCWGKPTVIAHDVPDLDYGGHDSYVEIYCANKECVDRCQEDAFLHWNTRINKHAEFLEELIKELKIKLSEFKADHNIFNWKKVYWNTETLTEYLIKKIEQFQAEVNNENK
jgi:hypothetical protein